MHDSSIIIGQVVLAFALAVVGGAISAAAAVSHERLCALISLAAGTLLGVTLFTILPESWEALTWWQLLLAAGSGYAVFFFISKYVFHVCPACAASHFDEATTHRFSEIASALIIALGIHSTLDGVALAVGHETSGRFDASLVLAVCVHKLPEGLALGALLLGAGFSKRKAVQWVAVVEATTLLGGAVGLWAFRDVGLAWLLAVMAHVGGGFVYLAVHAVFGELLKHSKRAVLVNFVIGIVLIGMLNVVVRFL